MNNNKKVSYQILALIATPKLADKAADMFLSKKVPVQFRLNALGTASSEIMDTLGFGSIDKCVMLSMVPEEVGRTMLGMLHTKLRLDAVNSGIAFTIPLTAASNLLVNMMNATAQNSEFLSDGKGEDTMIENKYALVAAVVNRGFSGDVMEAAKQAGAGGGTILHGRGVESSEASAFWGLSLQEEREILLILARREDKVKIMSAISEKYGMQSEAKGLVMSLPIDAVMGL